MSTAPINRHSQNTLPRARALITPAASGSDQSTKSPRAISELKNNVRAQFNNGGEPNYFGLISENGSVEFHANKLKQFHTASTQAMLAQVNAQIPTPVTDHVSYKNAVFLDGTKAGLVQIDGTGVLFLNHPDNTTKYFEVDDEGNLGNQIYPDDIKASDSKQFAGFALLNDDGANELTFYGIDSGRKSFSHSLQIDVAQNTINLSTRYDSKAPFKPPTNVAGTPQQLWQNAPLLDFNAPVGSAPTLDQTYMFYKQTDEGKLILDREEHYYQANWDNSVDPKSRDRIELFIARTKFNAGEGGIELFEQFMPNRTALLGDDDALDAYDEQYALIFADIKNQSVIQETGEQLDPSLLVIMAGGLSEVLAQSPERVNDVLTDIDHGWIIEYQHSQGGYYKTLKFPTQSARASIGYQLNHLLTSFATPGDTENIFAHEAAHSLDAQGSINLDGLPSLPANDDLVLRTVMSTLFTWHYESKERNPTSPDTFGLDSYAFTNASEFWGEISQYFLSGEEGATVIKNLSPDLYDVMSRYYNTDPLSKPILN